MRPSHPPRRGRRTGGGGGAGNNHARHSSLPSDTLGQIASTAVAANNSANNQEDRRSLLMNQNKQQHWSTSRLTGDGVECPKGSAAAAGEPRASDVTAPTAARKAASRSPRNFAYNRNTSLSLSPEDLAHFHASWTTVDTQDLFGASLQHPTSFATSYDTIPGERSTSLSFLSSSSLIPNQPAPYHRTVSSPRFDDSGISSVIHDAARITNWNRVLELCRIRPEDAEYICPRDGWTALHHTCNRRCPHAHVVEALITANPAALVQAEENQGWLPLHYACRFKAPASVVKLLLHLFPKLGHSTVSRVDRVKRTPLYYAIRYDAPPGVVGLLLEVDPKAVLEEDQNSESPLALVWDSWAEKLEGKRIVNSFIPGGFTEDQEFTVEERAKVLQQRLKKEPKLLKRWLKVNMLLKAAFGFPVEDSGETLSEKQPPPGSPRATTQQRKWRIVHAAAAVKCHPSLFLLACALHPEQVRELDRDDLYQTRSSFSPSASGATTAQASHHQTALHLAASSNSGGEPGKTILLELLREYREAAEIPDGIDGSLPLHRMVENERKQDWTNHAAILYRFYTRAVQVPDSKNKLPLHRAARAITQNTRSSAQEEAEESIVQQLVRVFPQACSHVDAEGCLPFHLIAGNAQVWDGAVEAVYNVHRAAVHTRAGPDQLNRLPIHMASASPCSQQNLIARLVSLHPRGAQLVDRQGKLPFHLACEVGKGWDNGTKAIYEAFSDAVSRPEDNPRGWLPLHMAASAPQAPIGLVQQLLTLNAAAAETPDQQSRYPLHLACDAGKSWNGGLKVLFDAAPSVMSATDRHGQLPLHIAALRYCSGGDCRNEDVLMLLPADEKRQHAIDTAAKEAAELDIIFHMVKADPTVVSSFV